MSECSEIQGFTVVVGLLSGKNVSQPMKAVYTFIISFSKVKKYTSVIVKNKIDNPKEKQCTVLWLLYGFLSREMFNLLF